MNKKRITIAAFRVTGLFLLIDSGFGIAGIIISFILGLLLKISLNNLVHILYFLIISILVIIIGIVVWVCGSSMARNLAGSDDQPKTEPSFEYVIVALLVAVSSITGLIQAALSLLNDIPLYMTESSSSRDIYLANTLYAATACGLNLIQIIGGFIIFSKLRNLFNKNNA